jgi:hypothetical protein
MPESRAGVLPWLLLALWVGGSGAMAGIGRLGMGLGQATSSRYTTMSTFFWVSVAVVVGVAVAHALARLGAAPAATSLVALVVVGLVAAAASYAVVWVRASRWVDSLDQAARLGRECVREWRVAPPACLAIVHHAPEYARERSATLERLRLGPLADPPARPRLGSFTLVETRTPAGEIRGALLGLNVVRFVSGSLHEYRSLELTIGGWARDPSTGRPPGALLFAADGVVIDQVPMPPSPDGAEPLWTYRFSAFRLPANAKQLDAYAVLDGGRIARLAGARPLDQLPKP